VETAAVEAELGTFFRGESSGIAAVYLFGSVARGEARASSDVDVAVLFERTPPRTLQGRPFELEAALESSLRRQVQLVTLNDAPPDLVHRVLRDGRLILDRDPVSRIRFEVHARNAYFDLEPVRRAYRRA
jgi:predicted nucleotidyltransferase